MSAVSWMADMLILLTWIGGVVGMLAFRRTGWHDYAIALLWPLVFACMQMAEFANEDKKSRDE